MARLRMPRGARQAALYLSDCHSNGTEPAITNALMRGSDQVSNDFVHWVRFFLNGVAETAANRASQGPPRLPPPTIVKVQVDGSTLRSNSSSRGFCRSPAKGSAMVKSVPVALSYMSMLPKRFMRDPVFHELSD